MNADEDEAQFMMNSAPIQELIKLTGLNQKGRKKGKRGRSTGKRKDTYLIPGKGAVAGAPRNIYSQIYIFLQQIIAAYTSHLVRKTAS